MSCTFRGAGKHEGPLGEVAHVYGKKKAKEESARLVLEYLLEVEQKRLDEAAAAMGMGGGMSGDGQGEPVFVDAVEVMG